MFNVNHSQCIAFTSILDVFSLLNKHELLTNNIFFQFIMRWLGWHQWTLLQLFTHHVQTHFYTCRWQKVEKLKILWDYFDWYFLMIYCLVFINWLMIDIDCNIKAMLMLKNKSINLLLKPSKSEKFLKKTLCLNFLQSIFYL